MKSSKDYFLEEQNKEAVRLGKKGFKRLNESLEFPRDWWNYWVNPITGLSPSEDLEIEAQNRRLKNDN